MKTTLAFIRELKNEVQGTQRSSWVIPKEVAVAYESFSLQSLSMDNSDGLSHSSNGVSPGGFTNVVVTIGRLRVTRVVERRVSTVLMHVIRLSQSHSLPISGSGSWPKKHEKSSRSRFVLVKKIELDLSGALNDGFLLNALKTLFRLSKVLLDL